MKLQRRTYHIPAPLLVRILEHLHLNWFESDEEGESYNNEEVIRLTEELEAWITRQEEVTNDHSLHRGQDTGRTQTK